VEAGVGVLEAHIFDTSADVAFKESSRALEAVFGGHQAHAEYPSSRQSTETGRLEAGSPDREYK
jgi:hypothetical protein